MTTPRNSDDNLSQEVLDILSAPASVDEAARLSATEEGTQLPEERGSASSAVPPSETPVVSVSNLWIEYGKFTAVKGISFVIPRGEVFGFIGPNGAGKSSTIRVMATLQ